jgi:hypothetical protein
MCAISERLTSSSKPLEYREVSSPGETAVSRYSETCFLF